MPKRRASRTTITGVIVLFLVLIAVAALSVVAIVRAKPGVPAAGETPGFSGNMMMQSGNDEPVSSDAEENSVAKEGFEVARAHRVLNAVDDSTAYRAFTGNCPDAPAEVELSVDGGSTWASSDLTQAAAVSAIQRIIVGVDDYVAAIALDSQDCDQPAAAVSFDGGNNWEVAVEALTQSWFIDPADQTLIHTPFGATLDAPCKSARLASAGVDAVALACSDGRVFTSSNGGERWDDGREILGTEALAATESAVYAAALNVPECEGVQVSEFDWSLNTVANYCADNATAKRGRVAVSATGDGTLWLWAGDGMHRSFDGGSTWEAQ